MSAVRLVDLTVGYDRHPAVHHLTGTFAPGSLTAIVGPNGAGKSTLLKAHRRACCARDPAGSTAAACARGAIAYLPQQAEIDRSFPISVARHRAARPLARGSGAFGGVARPRRRAAERRWRAVGLDGLRPPADRQPVGRPAPARAVRADPAPGRARDPARRAVRRASMRGPPPTSWTWSRRWHGEGRTVVAVLHDLEQVRRRFPAHLAAGPLLRSPGARPRACCARDNLLRAWGMPEAWDEQAAPCQVGEAGVTALRPADRALRRLRLHAPGAGRPAWRWRWAAGRSACCWCCAA